MYSQVNVEVECVTIVVYAYLVNDVTHSYLNIRRILIFVHGFCHLEGGPSVDRL